MPTISRAWQSCCSSQFVCPVISHIVMADAAVCAQTKRLVSRQKPHCNTMLGKLWTCAAQEHTCAAQEDLTCWTNQHPSLQHVHLHVGHSVVLNSTAVEWLLPCPCGVFSRGVIFPALDHGACCASRAKLAACRIRHCCISTASNFRVHVTKRHTLWLLGLQA